MMKEMGRVTSLLYENFYNILEQATLRLLRPKMALTLTGGLDTRVIAGILVKNDILLPAVTCGSKLEITIAGKVARTLNLKHYGYRCDVRDSPSFYHKIKRLGYQYLLTGSYFDEINGSWKGSVAKTYEQFEEACRYYMQEAKEASSRKYTDPDLYPRVMTPILEPDVQELLRHIPWQLRNGKKIQRWILKHKFPTLWRIPTYNSLLPNFLPFLFHGVTGAIHRELTYLFNDIKTKSYPERAIAVILMKRLKPFT